MKETRDDGLPGVAVQRHLGGSGNLNYCLKKIREALIVLLRDPICAPPQKKTDEKIWKCILCDLAYIIKVPQRDACNSGTNQGHFVNYVLFGIHT